MRAQITGENVNLVFKDLQRETAMRLNEKGNHILLSRHEIIGVITEEYNELVRAVEQGSLADVEDELKDIVVGGIVALASLKTGEVEW